MEFYEKIISDEYSEEDVGQSYKGLYQDKDDVLMKRHKVKNTYKQANIVTK